MMWITDVYTGDGFALREAQSPDASVGGHATNIISGARGRPAATVAAGAGDRRCG